MGPFLEVSVFSVCLVGGKKGFGAAMQEISPVLGRFVLGERERGKERERERDRERKKNEREKKGREGKREVNRERERER